MTRITIWYPSRLFENTALDDLLSIPFALNGLLASWLMLACFCDPCNNLCAETHAMHKVVGCYRNSSFGGRSSLVSKLVLVRLPIRRVVI